MAGQFEFLSALFIVWFAVLVAEALAVQARRPGEGASVAPVLPLFPIVGWIIAAALSPGPVEFGFYAVGAFHAVLGGAAVVSIARSVRASRRRRLPVARVVRGAHEL